MNYPIGIVGFNHKTSPLELRERLSFTQRQLKEFLKNAKLSFPLHEFLILSTCNRVEMYVGKITDKSEIAGFTSLLTSYHGLQEEYANPFMYSYIHEEAVRHLFEVAAGLDSLVVGETQILGQIKKAYRKAFKLETTGNVLNMGFQKALAVGKKVRSLTRISEGSVSISSISCQLAEEVLYGLQGKKILLIGTGKIGTLTLRILHSKGVDTILVSSRNYEKAKALSEEFKGTVVRFEELEKFMVEADVVITATSAPHYILFPSTINRVIRKRGGKPILLIDLAVPRDIDPLVRQIDGIYLYNIDSLKDMADQNMQKRETEIFKCRKIIAKDIKYFINKNQQVRGKNDQFILAGQYLKNHPLSISFLI